MPSGLPLRRLLPVLLLCTLAAALRAAPGTDEPAAAGRPVVTHPLAVVFVSPESILTENFPEPATLADWLKPVLAATDAALAAEAQPPAVLVQITLSPEAAPRYEIAGRPALDETFATGLRARLAALPELRPPLCALCLRIQTPGETASPLTEAATFIPRLFPPDEAALNRFIAADLATQYREIQAWARRHALPILAHRAAGSDTRFAGVVATGRAIAALAPDAPIDVARLAYRNPDFWRGVMEMAPGDQLVAALPVFLHAAAGDIDQASTLLGLLHSFGRESTLARQLLNELAARIGPFRRQLTTEVERGVALHDASKYVEAVAQHERTLAAYPDSAWARYELFLSTVTRNGLDTKKKIKRANKLWEETAPDIYRCNPLYNTQFAAIRGKSVGAMLDRLVLHRLANKPPEDFGERVGCFADAALRLEAYGPAALLYWSSLGTNHSLKGLSFRNDNPVPLAKEDVLARYLYCLEKLGVPDWKSEFEGDFRGAFHQLDASLAAHRGQ